jgi:hypothetical protein
LEIQILKAKQWSMEERIKEMEKAMYKQESELASQKEVAK